ncbi:MAG: nicotinate (nicotinamide) nucleotide adenylyltransferase [Clostridia bacterium]|nr:nicotinate (nicotinamide) nucleotide adenylyltransferase [Clostridia bacterium]
MKIGIFGGAFNPPHKMHKEIAVELLRKNFIDKVIYVPVADNYNKPNILKGTDRIKMLELMFEDHAENIEVSSFEVDGSLYTIHTLNHFHELYPNDEIYFICGTDNLNDLDQWNHYEEILTNFKLLVVSRNHFDFESIMKRYEKYREHIILAPIEARKISSTSIRNKIVKNGFTEELRDDLDENVIDYLKKIDYMKYWSE